MKQVNPHTMQAIVETGGKQYLVTEGQKLRVETLEAEVGSKIILDKVLLVTDGTKAGTKIGQPYLTTKVEAKVVSSGRGEKIRIFKKKPKTRYVRSQGHRQNYTEIEIVKI